MAILKWDKITNTKLTIFLVISIIFIITGIQLNQNSTLHFGLGIIEATIIIWILRKYHYHKEKKKKLI